MITIESRHHDVAEDDLRRIVGNFGEGVESGAHHAAEPAALRDEYGRNTAGARMLLARRLVEAGVRLVNLTYGGWDMHDQIVAGFRNQMPQFDQAFARLILDLETRGLLDSTLVMVSSEFGRTPKINGTAGRDHWPKVFSVMPRLL